MSVSVHKQVVGSEGTRQPRWRHAYEGCLPEMLALDKERLRRVNLDIPTIVTNVLGAMSEICSLKSECERHFKLMDFTLFDSLQARTLALGYAHSLFQAASVPTLPVQELSTRVVGLRTKLEVDVRAAAARDVIDPLRLNELKGNVGYKNQAFDLVLLAALARGAWAKLDGRTYITLEELDEAEVLADQLLTAVGERAQLPVVAESAADIRVRAFTLFMDGYEEILRYTSCLRYHDKDIEQWVPSLYAGRSGNRYAEPEAPAPAAPPPTSHESGVVPAITAPASDVPVGMPGSDPFIKSSKG